METDPGSYRLFLAISLPEAIKAEISKAQAKLRNALPRGSVRWTKPEQFHLTLKFLGNVKVDRVEALKQSLREACAGFATLRLRAERLGCFPDRHYPRVIWVSVQDAGERLSPLQAAIEKATGSYTTQKAEKKFTGHVTLGRCPGIKRSQAELLTKLALAMNERSFGDWTADKIELIRSELNAGGSRYTTLAAINLAAETSFRKLPSA